MDGPILALLTALQRKPVEAAPSPPVVEVSSRRYRYKRKRARASKSTMRRERANSTESTIANERATKAESAKFWERATIPESATLNERSFHFSPGMPVWLRQHIPDGAGFIRPMQITHTTDLPIRAVKTIVYRLPEAQNQKSSIDVLTFAQICGIIGFAFSAALVLWAIFP